MGIKASIGLQTIVSLDTNIFIYALDHPGLLGNKARELLEQIKETKAQVYISVLTLEEFFIKVYKQGRKRETLDIIKFLTLNGSAKVVDINQNIALTAAQIRARYASVRAPDALHLAAAVKAGAKIFFTLDRRLPKKMGKLSIKPL